MSYGLIIEQEEWKQTRFSFSKGINYSQEDSIHQTPSSLLCHQSVIDGKDIWVSIRWPKLLSWFIESVQSLGKWSYCTGFNVFSIPSGVLLVLSSQSNFLSYWKVCRLINLLQSLRQTIVTPTISCNISVTSFDECKKQFMLCSSSSSSHRWENEIQRPSCVRFDQLDTN